MISAFGVALRQPCSPVRRPSGARTGVALAAASMAAACATSGVPGLPSPTAGDGFFVSGYHAYWTGGSWSAYPWESLDQLYFFEVEVEGDGSLGDLHGWPDDWQELRRRARSAGVSLVLTVSMHDAAAFSELFTRPERVKRAVDSLVRLLAGDPSLGGLQLDFEIFEPVNLEARDGYTAFVAELERTMAALDRPASLSVFAMAFDEDDAYNERALAALADFLVVQGYDFHHQTDGRAGPLGATRGWGTLNWQSVVDRFLDMGVPARKIVMAVPLYGYEWPVTAPDPGAETLGPAQITPLAPAPDVVPELPRARARAAEHGTRRDAESGIPYYAYRDGDGWRQGWFEDLESLREKYAFVREHGLGGVALFPLGYGDRAIWDELRSAFTPPRGGIEGARSR